MANVPFPIKSQDTDCVEKRPQQITKSPLLQYFAYLLDIFEVFDNKTDRSIVKSNISWHPQKSYVAIKSISDNISIFDTRKQIWLHDIQVPSSSDRKSKNLIFGMNWLPNSDNLLVCTSCGVTLFMIMEIGSKSSKIYLRSCMYPSPTFFGVLRATSAADEGPIANKYSMMDISPQGRLFATICEYDNYMYIWDAGLMLCDPVYCLDGTRAALLRWAPSGGYIAVVNTKGDIFLVSCESWKHTHVLQVANIRSIIWLGGKLNRLLVLRENSCSLYLCTVLESEDGMPSDTIHVNAIPSPFHIIPPPLVSLPVSLDNSDEAVESRSHVLAVDRLVASSCGLFLAASFNRIMSTATAAVGATLTSAEPYVAVYSYYQQSPALLSLTQLRYATDCRLVAVNTYEYILYLIDDSDSTNVSE